MTNNIKIKKFNQEILNLESPDDFNEACDAFFDYQYESVENSIRRDESLPNLYLKNQLNEEALNTSWFDYRQIISLAIDNNLKVLDLGSAYSKGSLLAQAMGTNNFYSVEYIYERISWALKKANELGHQTKQYINADALNIDLSSYDVIFLYQPTGRFLSSLLNRVSQNNGQIIWAVESHGDLIHRLKLDSRLSYMNNELKLASQRHDSFMHSFTVNTKPVNTIVQFENELYNSRYILFKSKNDIFGSFTWIKKANECYIDFIDGIATLNTGGARLKVTKEHSNIEFTDKINQFQEWFLGKEYITYKGREQRIIKVISAPQDALELSLSGWVNKKDLY